MLFGELACAVVNHELNADLVFRGARRINGDVLELVGPLSAAGSGLGERVSGQIEGIVPVRCVEENLPLVGLNAVAFQGVQVHGPAGVEVDDQFAVVALTLQDEAMDVPFGVGNRLGSHKLDVVLVFLADVDHGVGIGSELIGQHVVGFNGHVDDSGVTVLVVQHQGDVPLFALSASGLRSQVCLAEHHAGFRLGRVAGDTTGKAAAVPVGRTVDDPVGLKRDGCVGFVAEGQRGRTLHVLELVFASARVNREFVAVDLQIQTVVEGTKTIRVGVDLVLEQVAQHREGRAVRSLGVGGHVDGRDDHTT